MVISTFEIKSEMQKFIMGEIGLRVGSKLLYFPPLLKRRGPIM
jgi:hypothetical protein